MKSPEKQRWGREAGHLLKLAGLMLAAAVVIPVTMISLGLLLGPRGYEGLVLAPLSVLSAWALILFFGLKPRATPRRVQRARVGQLPAEVGSLLTARRSRLPLASRPAVDKLLLQLSELDSTASALTSEHPSAARLRRLLVDDLTFLVENYQRLPERVRTRPLHGGPSPEQQLLLGLDTISGELERVHHDLCQEDLRSLATKQRYLELKYGAGEGDGPKTPSR